MTLTRGPACLVVAIAAAGALAGAAGPAAGPSTVRLKTISARVNSKGASLVIEASEPVGYSLTRPDPLTVLVEFRNVMPGGVANSVDANTKSSPIAKVSVETGDSMGAPASRVRIALAQPVAHRVRSDRNTVVVDFDKPNGKSMPYVMPPISRQSAGGSQDQSAVGSHDGAPDAMDALRQPEAVDPIAALGLDGASPAKAAPMSASIAPRTPAAPTQAVVAPPAARANAAPQAAATQTPPVPGTVTQTDQPGSRQGRQFTGHPISLDFQGA